MYNICYVFVGAQLCESKVNPEKNECNVNQSMWPRARINAIKLECSKQKGWIRPLGMKCLLFKKSFGLGT